MRIQLRVLLSLVLLFINIRYVYGIQEPCWVRNRNQIEVSKITDKDKSYLSEWVAGNAISAEKYITSLFLKHQVVVFGEQHNIREHKEFIIRMIPKLYKDAGVRCIGWEYSNKNDNSELNKIINSPKFDTEKVLDFARRQAEYCWNSKEHWDIIRAVWQLNHNLKPGEEKMRLIGLPMYVDWAQYWIIIDTRPKDSPEYKQSLNIPYDQSIVETVEKDIIRKGVKSLIFCGMGHDTTLCGPDINGTPIAANLLHEKYGDKVFQVRPYSVLAYPLFVEDIMEKLDNKQVGFNISSSPFRFVLLPSWMVLRTIPGNSLISMDKTSQGFVYLCSGTKQHANTPIKGFVTDEMFRKYHEFYEIDFKRKFKDAREFDLYLQQNRWVVP